MNNLPQRIGQYTFVRDVIGSGAFALVVRGHLVDNPSDQVAIKAIAKKNLCRHSNLLEKETRILKELTALKHKNLVALLHCEENDTHVFLVMEYCNAGDLADFLQSQKKLNESTIKIFLRQIAEALKVIHSCGIVHRDLKPQNILMCLSTTNDNEEHHLPENYILKIADFGFARFLKSGVMAGTLCGSPMYMAPEVLMSLQYDGKADLWSIGTIVYQCLVGNAPFQARSPPILRHFYERNSELKPKVLDYIKICNDNRLQETTGNVFCLVLISLKMKTDKLGIVDIDCPLTRASFASKYHAQISATKGN
ncbi:hypothetical protein GJ496_000657 [Pomphorhynchus laevis]|nr:hypothetical protein GJ496_000657 [Pomphorhynchus laevis]